MSALDADDDDAMAIEIEPPKPKRKMIATLQVSIYLGHNVL